MKLWFFGLAVFGLALLRLVVGVRRAFAWRIGMLHRPAVSVRVPMRFGALCSRTRRIWHRPDFPRLARIVAMPGVRPGDRVIAIHGVRRTIIPADVPVVMSCIARPIRVPVVWTIRATRRFRSIGAMVRSAVGARCNYVAVEVTRVSAGRHCRPAVVHRRPLRTICARYVFVLDLLSSSFKMMLVLRNPFAFAGARLNSVRPAVVADVIDRGVVHYHGSVVGVVDDRGVDVGHRAVVHKLSSAPFPAPKTHARVAVPVINAAVEANMRSPIAAVPYVKAIGKYPISRRPKETGFRGQDPRSGNPVIAVFAIGPISGSPDITRGRANRLDIHRQHRRPDPDRNAYRDLCIGSLWHAQYHRGEQQEPNKSQDSHHSHLSDAAFFVLELPCKMRKIGPSASCFYNPFLAEKLCCRESATRLCV